MAAKISEEDQKLIDLFLASGIDEKRAKEAITNKNGKKNLESVILAAKKVPGCDVKEVINILLLVATTLAPEAVSHRDVLVEYVATKKIGKSNLSFALAYLKKVGGDPLDRKTFEAEAGVGISLNEKQIADEVSKFLEKHKKELLEHRYANPLTKLLSSLRETAPIKFADQLKVKEAFDAAILKLLGPMTEDDKKAQKAAISASKDKASGASKTPAKGGNENSNNNVNEAKELVKFPDPRDNKQLKPSILEEHLKFSSGKVICRFPPEPNGSLHIGHAKSMNLNFSYPANFGGYTILRFDDTNPEAERKEYFDGIIRDVAWLGHTPKMTTWSSDWFPKLYELAVELIKRGKAYVDDLNGDEIADFREKKKDSPYRNRSVAENLKLFEDMKKGKFDEGHCTLRMKMNMQADNTVMRDLIAYRIKYLPHPHAGDKWCIYPSYDYTHCIIDSLENITHSLCTTEFIVRRESYYWLLDALELYKPVVWEYSRLNITHFVMSKRKLTKLVAEGMVRGWDDPRLPTLAGMRRRGYTPAAINKFCDRIGVTRNESIIHSIELLEHCVREDLNETCHRRLVVQVPVKVVIENWNSNLPTSVEAPNYPAKPEFGTRKIPISSVIYIDADDFKTEDAKGYKRLAPGQTVGLVHAGATITATSFKSGKNGVEEIRATIDFSGAIKPRGWIHWVDSKENTPLEIRLYGRLFKSANPALLDNFMDDVDRSSLKVINSFGEINLKGSKLGDRFQFERTGYFACDDDTTPSKVVFNRTVTLKESSDKKEIDA